MRQLLGRVMLAIVLLAGTLAPASAQFTGNRATTAIADGSVGYAKVQNVGATKLLGNPTGSPAAPSEISLGKGMAFSGTTLSGWRGVVASKAASQTAINVSTATALTFDTNSIDTSGGTIHSTSSNTDQFVIPSGVTVVNACYNIRATSVGNGSFFTAFVSKNGTDIGVRAVDSSVASVTIGAGVAACSGPMLVAAADIIRFNVQSSDTSLDIVAGSGGDQLRVSIQLLN